MKKLFTLVAGALLCLGANAASTYQIVGGYNSWSLDTAIELEAQGNGKFVGTVPELTSGFKIVGDRSWHPQYGMISNDDALVLNTPLVLGCAETDATPDFKNIELGDNIISISNCVVTFDPAAKTIMVSGNAKKGYPELYVSGSFCGWGEPGNSAAPKMDRDEDIYYTVITFTSAGEFKIFGAGWSPEFGFISEDDVTTITEEDNTVYIKRGGKVNVPYDIIGECEIDFDFSTGELTIIKLEDVDPDDIDLYISGSFCNWAIPGTEASVAMTRDGNIYTATLELEGKGDFKVFGANWAPGFGFETWDDVVTLGQETTEITLIRDCTVNVPYEVEGDVEVTFDIKTGKLIWAPVSSGVEGIDADNAAAVYYNLQGIRVAAPVEGQVYISVRGNKAAKVVL